MKTAYVFPGQGSQYPGMAKDLYENNATARQMLERANEILGFRITDVMFNGTAEDLKQTAVTQPAIFLHSVVLAKCLPEFTPDMVAGHSLGEFSALVAAGALDFEDGLKLVAIRAHAMQKACEITPGAMAAIIGLETEKIEEVCAACNLASQFDITNTVTYAYFTNDIIVPTKVTHNVVVPANYNYEGQVVISGSKEAVEAACTKLKEAGAKRALPLPVSGAFHSPLMEPARAELAGGIEKAVFHTPQCPIYQNATALPSVDPATIKANLLAQLTSPVRWTQTIQNMIADGAISFIELGPGKVLQGIISKTAGSEILVAGLQDL